MVLRDSGQSGIFTGVPNTAGLGDSPLGRGKGRQALGWVAVQRRDHLRRCGEGRAAAPRSTKIASPLDKGGLQGGVLNTGTNPPRPVRNHVKSSQDFTSAPPLPKRGFSKERGSIWKAVLPRAALAGDGGHALACPGCCPTPFQD